MRAAVGDRLVISGHHVGEPERDAEVLEVHGQDGGPPWLVRWSDDGHEGLFFPRVRRDGRAPRRRRHAEEARMSSTQ